MGQVVVRAVLVAAVQVVVVLEILTNKAQETPEVLAVVLEPQACQEHQKVLPLMVAVAVAVRVLVMLVQVAE